MKKSIVIALAGNPNAGKTTVFNNLTGARQKIANYPGVTVEKKEGVCSHNGRELKIVDLPGTYSLTAYSAEEVIARDVILNEKPDVVVDIIDSSNLERNLYLAVQLMELGVPLVWVFNMSDLAKAKGYEFDLGMISSLTGIPVVRAVGPRKEGMTELLDAALKAAELNVPNYPQVNYGIEIEKEIEELMAIIEKRKEYEPFINVCPVRWAAIKLLEKDSDVMSRIKSQELIDYVKVARERLGTMLGEPVEAAIAGARYGFISGLCSEATKSTIEIRHNMSDKVDAVVINRVWGIPIFLGIMYLIFQFTFTIGEYPMGWLEDFFGFIGETVSGFWPEGSESQLKSLIVDGIIGGVGGVLVFLPNIVLLFLAISILEDTGYMARVAFLMDKVMHKLGLHGKSFIPLLLGFGCSVPAIMAARTLDSERDRLTTMMVTPLMSCGARLPIYALIIPAFFPEAQHGNILWLIYVIGMVLAILLAKMLRNNLFKGEAMPFIMELPPYRLPTLKGIGLHVWERSSLYLQKAGTVLLAVSVLLWAAATYPQKEFTEAELASLTPEQQQSETLIYTISGRIGQFMEPVIQTMGFDWRIGTALIGALAAKEVMVAQLGIVYSIGEADEESEPLRDSLKEHYTPLTGFCLMLFSLISAPCVATFAVMRRESNSWKWASVQFAGLTALAWLITTLVYQIGSVGNALIVS